jgi:recombination protein RecT
MTKEKKQLATGKEALAIIKTKLESHASFMLEGLPLYMRNKATVDRLNRLALTGVMRQPKLFECSPTSIVKCVMDASALGLDCSGLLGRAYLVPFRNRKSGKYEAQLIVGYKGHIELAIRSGKVKDIRANLVYADDIFEYEDGLEVKLRHVKNLDSSEKDADIVAAYAIAVLEKDIQHAKVVSRKKLLEIMNRTKSRDSNGNIVGPWITDFGPMCLKTAVRQLSNYISMSIEQEMASSLDASEQDYIDADFELPELEQKTGVDAVKEDLGIDEPPADVETVTDKE